MAVQNALGQIPYMQVRYARIPAELHELLSIFDSIVMVSPDLQAKSSGQQGPRQRYFHWHLPELFKIIVYAC